MTAARHEITSYVFDATATYFVDTNVWFLVYGPTPPGDPRARVYSDGIKRLRASGAGALIDPLVVSEFANTWARFEFRRQPSVTDFKTFRNSPRFRTVAKDIVLALKSILSIAKPTGTAFANINLSPLLTAFEAGGSDLNDLLILETCRARSCVLITDDGDMKSAEIPVVTANKTLLT